MVTREALPAATLAALETVGSSAQALGVLAGILAVHEGGHFAAARFLGITRRVENARCTAFWCVSAPDLTKHDVEVRYARRSDKHESVRLVCVHKDALPQLAQNSMPGCHRGGAALFLGTFDL